ncbi:hypothetical protein QJQ45_025877 [Haematococcus lacustris]|nr:hypothetical protein QJQ45_025877 [Haematococcus lacustris]
MGLELRGRAPKQNTLRPKPAAAERSDDDDSPPLLLPDPSFIRVARDITGQRFHNGFPVVSHGPSAQALKQGWPFPVTCCWNGPVVLNAEPFKQRGLQFRAHGPGECAASECSLMCDDFWRLGYSRALVDPSTYAPWDPYLYYDNLLGEAVPMRPWSNLLQHAAQQGWYHPTPPTPLTEKQAPSPPSPVFEPLPATSNATNNSIPSSTVPSNSSSADTGGSEFAMSGGDIDQAKHPEVKGSTPGFLTWLHRMVGGLQSSTSGPSLHAAPAADSSASNQAPQLPGAGRAGLRQERHKRLRLRQQEQPVETDHPLGKAGPRQAALHVLHRRGGRMKLEQRQLKSPVRLPPPPDPVQGLWQGVEAPATQVCCDKHAIADWVDFGACQARPFLEPNHTATALVALKNRDLAQLKQWPLFLVPSQQNFTQAKPGSASCYITREANSQRLSAVLPVELLCMKMSLSDAVDMLNKQMPEYIKHHRPVGPMTAAWSLSAAQRDETARRVASNLFTMGFTKFLPISDDQALEAAISFEEKAYTAASVAATTTTGNRPLSETTKAYSRKLSEQVIELIKAGGIVAAASQDPQQCSGEELDLFGSRDFLTESSAKQALAPLLARGSSIRKVRLSTKSFGRDAATVAASALANVSATLTDVDISDIIAGRPEDEALDALRIISAALLPARLARVNLSDNALGEKGVRAAGDLLSKQPALEALSLQNVGCSIHACRAVEELLQQTTSLSSLQLFNNMSDNQPPALYLAFCTPSHAYLHTLRFATCVLPPPGYPEPLGSALLLQPQTVCGCAAVGGTLQGALHIAAVLAHSPHMADFRMASSRVGPSGGIALAKALTTGRHLVKLDISDNPMTAAVGPALAALVLVQPCLKILNVNDTSLTDKGAMAVAVALGNSSCQLEELEMALNEITPAGAKAVAAAVASKGGSLKRVNLRENELEDRGAVIIARGLAKAPGLVSIDLCGNQLKRVGAVAVAKAAANSCASLTLLALDENTVSETGLDEVRDIMEAAGKGEALGPLDENMEEDDEELEEEEDEEDGDDASDLPPQAPHSSQAATQAAASEPGPSTPQHTKPTKGKAAKAKPAPQPGRWLDRDCNAALNMQRIGESRWRPLELCFWPDQGALPAKGKEYPGLGYKRLRDKPPKAQEQEPAEAQTFFLIMDSGPPKCRIELPKPGDDAAYGGTRTVSKSYIFDVSNQIGEGTYGQVFHGRDRITNDEARACSTLAHHAACVQVALKKIRMDTEKEGFPITAIREIKILSSMQHENVVNLREIIRSDIHKNNNYKGSIYMVFDYAEHDLTGLMDSNKFKFTEAQVKCIMKQLLKGLAYVHGNGVLHRDLKASNILIDKHGSVKLADFGLARTWQERQDSRLTNRVITLWYRPPELLLGAERYGPEVDMWSVGAIFAELLVGKPIFPGSNEMEQLDKIFAILGTPNETSWPGIDSLKLQHLLALTVSAELLGLRSWPAVPKNKYPKGLGLRSWVRETALRAGHQAAINPAAVALLEKLLTLDPTRRIDAINAFQDPWFWNDNPAPCDPKDLPCGGSSHEFTMKKRRNEQRHEQPMQLNGPPQGMGQGHPGGPGGMRGGPQPHGGRGMGMGPGGPPGGQGGGGDPHKRGRYAAPPGAGGVSGGNGIRFYDRDVSAALNIRRIAAGPGRPRELSSWLDRFIPLRPALDVDLANLQLTKENTGNGADGSEGASLSPSRDEFQRALAGQLGIDQSGRILAFRQKAPAPPEGHDNNLRGLYTDNLGPAPAKKNFRHIPQTQERILDAPDLVDDYYLNLLDWSCNNSSNLLATGGGTADRCIKFWNTHTGVNLSSIDTGSQVGELTGHQGRVLHMATSPDGSSVVSAGADETLRFWRVFGEPVVAKDESKAAGAAGTGSMAGSVPLGGLRSIRPRGSNQLRGRVVLVDEHRTTRVSSAVNGKQPCEEELEATSRAAWSQQRDMPVRGLMWCLVVAPCKPPQAPCSSQEATLAAASEPGPSTPPPTKRTKAEQTIESQGKAAKAKPVPQLGRWLDRDCNAALNMQRIGGSRWRPLELCYWADQGALPANRREYPGLGYKWLRDKPPKAQQQPAEAHTSNLALRNHAHLAYGAGTGATHRSPASSIRRDVVAPLQRQRGSHRCFGCNIDPGSSGYWVRENLSADGRTPVQQSPATFAVHGSSSLAVPAGAVEIQVSFSGIQIYSESQDLCSKTACPVPPGPVTINIVEDLPPIAPPVSEAQDQLQGTAYTSPLSGDYGLRVIGTDAAGNELMCLDVDFELVLPSESTSLRHLVPGSTGKTQEHIMLATGMAAEHIKQVARRCASGSGQQEDEGKGQGEQEVIAERRQVIKAAFRGLVEAARPDLSPEEVDAVVAQVNQRMTMGSMQCCLRIRLLPGEVAMFEQPSSAWPVAKLQELDQRFITWWAKAVGVVEGEFSKEAQKHFPQQVQATCPRQTQPQQPERKFRDSAWSGRRLPPPPHESPPSQCFQLA